MEEHAFRANSTRTPLVAYIFFLWIDSINILHAMYVAPKLTLIYPAPLQLDSKAERDRLNKFEGGNRF